jgi:hypothetical protein
VSASPHDPLLPALEAEVQAELELVETSGPANATLEPITEWQFDPADIVREEVELQNLLGAVGALDARPGNHPDGSR